MERLTQSNFNYCEEYCTDADGCGYAQGKIPTACADAAQYYRLAAYEDTGLEPGEVQAWKQAEAEGRLMVLDTQKEDTYPGLKRKYIVLKADTGNTVENCFVLRPHKDPAAKIALEAYAKATDNKTLSDDITNWIGAIGNIHDNPELLGGNDDGTA